MGLVWIPLGCGPCVIGQKTGDLYKTNWVLTSSPRRNVISKLPILPHGPEGANPHLFCFGSIPRIISPNPYPEDQRFGR
jgi:hypothetical protein